MPHKDAEAKRKYHREYQARRKKEDPDYKERRQAAGRKAARKRKAKIRAMLRAAKDKPCVDCGERFPPEIMDLDHVRGKKLFNLAGIIQGTAGYYTYTQIEEEIAKCDPRDPTCHRLRHFKENDGRL